MTHSFGRTGKLSPQGARQTAISAWSAILLSLLVSASMLGCQDQWDPIQSKPPGDRPAPGAAPGEKAGTLRYEARQFTGVVAGKFEQWNGLDHIMLWGSSSCFTIPLRIDSAGEYEMQMCALRSVTGPVILDVVNPDDPNTATAVLASLRYPEKPVGWSTETVTLRLHPTVRELKIRFANDAITPQGDRNAYIRRVVIRPVADPAP